MPSIQSRRHFLASLTAAGAAGVLGGRGALADEGPPETTTRKPAFPRIFALERPRNGRYGMERAKALGSGFNRLGPPVRYVT